jgi:hypothetical protein
VVLTNATPSLRRYIAGMVVQDIDANGGRSTRRLLHDHLGSVSAVISDASSTVLERYDYGAFGERRGALGNALDGWSTPVRTNRGFTGHEMLDDFGLVHMNGRIYDSRTARLRQAPAGGSPRLAAIRAGCRCGPASRGGGRSIAR